MKLQYEDLKQPKRRNAKQPKHLGQGVALACYVAMGALFIWLVV